MNRIIFFWLLALQVAGGVAFGQSLQGTIDGYPDGMLYLLGYDQGDFSYTAADSARTDGGGGFRMRQPSSPGMYLLCQGPEGRQAGNPSNTLYLWLGFGEDVELHSRVNQWNAEVRFTRGVNNTYWYENDRRLGRPEQRLNICLQLLDGYPDTAGVFYGQIRREYEQAQLDDGSILRQLEKEERGHWTIRLQRRMKPPFTGGVYRQADRMAYWRQHLLDSIDLSNDTLQASHLPGMKMQSYMQLFGFPYAFADRRGADSGLMPAVKGILRECRQGAFTRHDVKAQARALQYAGSWLYHFLSDKGMDSCLAYTASQMPAEAPDKTCGMSAGVGKNLQRMQASQRLKKGMAAPEISLNGQEAKTLADIKASRTLVVFWASGCPHCQQFLPQLKKLYDSSSRKDWEILAVSVDTSARDWTTAIANNGYRWLNFCDLKGWDSKAAQDYGVSATPQMYLLDSRKRIVASPVDIAELKKLLAPTDN
jgi:peroxiredoxin